MRDIVLTTVVVVMLPFIFWRPFIGALMWVWISMMNPHRLTYGWAYTLPFAYAIAVTTLIAMMLSRQRKPFPLNTVSGLMVAFTAWMCVTSLFAMNSPDVVYQTWLQVMKTQLMLFVTLMLIRGRAQIDMLIWTIVLSVGYFGVKGGIFTLLHGGQYTVWGPPGSFIEGNNELGLALTMLLPLMYYLSETTSRRWVRYGLWFAMGACGLSILGTHSRGDFLAIGCAALFLGVKSRRPVLLTLVLAVGLVGAVLFMPADWMARMATIETYQSDPSALARLNTWQTIWNMVKARPIVGAGFELANPLLFQLYSPRPDTEVFAAHSIYFQALGEHGFVGLALYLALGVSIWRRASRLAGACHGVAGMEWVERLMRMLQASLAAFAVGGAFLGLLHYDLPYYLGAIVVLVQAAVDERTARAVDAAADTKPMKPVEA